MFFYIFSMSKTFSFNNNFFFMFFIFIPCMENESCILCHVSLFYSPFVFAVQSGKDDVTKNSFDLLTILQYMWHLL